jgi:hypothetical protein
LFAHLAEFTTEKVDLLPHELLIPTNYDDLEVFISEDELRLENEELLANLSTPSNKEEDDISELLLQINQAGEVFNNKFGSIQVLFGTKKRLIGDSGIQSLSTSIANLTEQTEAVNVICDKQSRFDRIMGANLQDSLDELQLLREDFHLLLDPIDVKVDFEL